MSLDVCLDKLRYVKYGDEVRASDVLAKLECLKALRDTLKAKATEVDCPSERIDPLVDQLDSIIAMIRYVRSGDIIQPEDHNYVVDALKKARDILSEIESWCAGLKDQLDKCRADLEKCQFELSRCLERVRVCACEVVDYAVHYGGLAKTPDLLLDVWEFRGFIPPHVYLYVLYYELLYKPADASRDAFRYELLAKVADVARDALRYDSVAKTVDVILEKPLVTAEAKITDVVLDRPLVEVKAETATASSDILTIEREVRVG